MVPLFESPELPPSSLAIYRSAMLPSRFVERAALTDRARPDMCVCVLMANNHAMPVTAVAHPARLLITVLSWH